MLFSPSFNYHPVKVWQRFQLNRHFSNFKEEDMEKLLFTLMFAFVSVVAAGPQAAAQLSDGTLIVNNGDIGSFFMSLFAGLILAIGFQILLTILSVACGVSIFGNIEERFAHSAPKSGTSSSGNPLVKISTGIGVWTLITTSLSLFFASMLAVKMSLIASNQIGLTLGLVIWAAFFITMTYFEMRSASSILGGIFATVFSGVKSSAQYVQEMFSKSPVEKTADAIRHEIAQTLQDPHLHKAVKDYAKDFKLPSFDLNKAKKELVKLLGDLELKATSRNESGLERETFISLAEKHAHFSKEDVQKLGQLYDEAKDSAKEAKEAAKAPGSGADKVLNAIEKLAPGSDEDTKQVREKFENYLRSAGVEALNPESLKEDLNKIVSDPKSTKQVVLNRIKQFDHPTIVSIVSKKANMSKEQANQVVNRVESVLESIKEKANTASEKVETTIQSAQDKAAQAGAAGAGGNGGSFKNAIEEKVRGYFTSLQRPELDYEQIKHDFEQMFHDPKASPEILKARLKSLDRGSLTALIGSWPNVSQENAERIVNKIEEARNNILQKTDEIEQKVKAKTQEAKESALHQAENVRKSVVVSAWWLFATAMASACASALGGILALG
jgi:hypothetical protein